MSKTAVSPDADDEITRIASKYDTNNNGTWSLAEVKMIVTDLRKVKKQKRRIMILSALLVGFVLILLLGNFGLVVAGVALTQQLKTSSADSGATPVLQDRSATCYLLFAT